MDLVKILQSAWLKWPWRRGPASLPNPITLTMTDGVRVVVPDSLNLITPYVLIEQHDWFEDEIKFLRRVLLPGQKVIDIGANYGVYTLSMAKTVGPAGSVWAFEPATRTAAFLIKGVAANKFSQVILENSALSFKCGAAQLAIHAHSELNSLVQDGQAPTPSETVRVVTLDECLLRYRWTAIDFMKMDAEGEETNILKGGQTFFSRLSPLIQYEVKAGADLHLSLVADFAALGYASYRLVPGLNLLVTFDPNVPTDAYLLNLFCCGQRRAEQLINDGLLVDAAFSNLPAATKRIESLYRSTASEYTWEENIARLPYGVRVSERWEKVAQTADGMIVVDALGCYALSRDPKMSAEERFLALQTAMTALAALCQRQPNPLRLSSLARVARDFGARSVAVVALDQLAGAIANLGPVDFNEPFLLPVERFDSIPPGENIANWLLASVLEAIEELSAFSSFYSGHSAKDRLEKIATLGFGNEEMARRLRLVLARLGESATIG